MALSVPFADKDDAKKLGAIWVGHEKTWAIPLGVDSEPFKKWMEGEPRILGMYLAILEARAEKEALDVQLDKNKMELSPS